MGWLFGSAKKMFNVPVSTATQIVKIVTEADEHAYTLSEAEKKIESEELRLFHDAKKNVLNGIIYSDNQFRNSSLSEDRVEVVYNLFVNASKGFERLKQNTLVFERYGEEIIDFVSKSENAINKYIRDKGHDVAVELKLIRENERQVIHDALSLKKLCSDVHSNIIVLINLLELIHKNNVKNSGANISKFHSISSLIKRDVIKIENAIMHMRGLNNKIRAKLERVGRLDERLNNDLRHFVAEAQAKQPEYKGGNVYI